MKNVLIINDISGLGNCSMGANLPIFSKLGHYGMPIVTAAFSCQTGFVKFTYQANQDILQCVDDVYRNRLPDAVYVGFCVNNEILSNVRQAVQNLRDTYVFVDPILGDDGKLYCIFNDEYVQQMKSFVKCAQCITPNLTEACLLADIDYNELLSYSQEPTFLAICGKKLENFLSVVGVPRAVITGVQCGTLVGNIVLEQGQKPRYVTNERVNINYSGTGDVFSSVICGELLNGADLLTATQIAANFVEKAASLTQCTDRRFGVEFSRVLDVL